MLSSLFSNIRRTRFNQSSPVQPISEIRKSREISKNNFKKKMPKKEVKNAKEIIGTTKAQIFLDMFQYYVFWPEVSSLQRDSKRRQTDNIVTDIATYRLNRPRDGLIKIPHMGHTEFLFVCAQNQWYETTQKNLENPKPSKLRSWNVERTFSPHHVLHVSCHVSCVACQVSGVTCQVSHVTCHMYFFLLLFSDKLAEEEVEDGGSLSKGHTV